MRKLPAVMLLLGLGVCAGPVMGGDDPKDTKAERAARAERHEEGVLKLSMDSVRKVQQALCARGYPVTKIDGTVNDETEKAIKAFQKGVNFKETGDLDVATLNALGLGAVVAISNDVKGAEYVKEEMKREASGFAQRPPGMPAEVTLVSTGERGPIGYIILGTDEIEAIQKSLASGKFFAGSNDGAFSAELIAALRTFQYAKGIHATGVVDIQTLAWFPDTKIEVELTNKLDDPRSVTDGFTGADRSEKVELGVLRLPMESVRKVQLALVARGYAIGTIDGTVNDETRAAIKGLQKGVNFKETGDLDVATLNALGFEAAVAISNDVKGADLARTEMLRDGVSERPAGMPIDANMVTKCEKEPLGYIMLGSRQLKAIQNHLKEAKFYVGDENGAISAEFIAAIRTFQKAKGIRATGMIDLQTLAWIPEAKVKVEPTNKLGPKHH